MRPMIAKSNLSLEEARRRAELVRDVAYRIALDLTGESALTAETVVRFRCAEPGAETFLDVAAADVRTIELNGSRLPAEAWTGTRVRLRGLQAENEVRIVASCPYNRTELGMHRFVDPADGNVYLHTHFEPFGAHRVFACFDQPDLKAPFAFTMTVPAGWQVVSNAPAPHSPERDGRRERWRFAATEPISTYITAICAGPFHSIRERHREIDLGLHCRQSLAVHLDAGELFEVTKQGFDFFEPAFGYPYMFGGSYDQVFIPESNSGAMENAGCVTFNDVYLFRSRVTDAARERRAETVLHEMAHMWFGDLVTMRWWNDLWLNESFASYMAVLALVENTRFRESWTTFADTEKTWAIRQDQLPTTHPIVAEIPDVESIHLNFDGITYAKGASVLKQLVAWVGQDRFLDGMKVYCRRHAFGNATLEDFLAALEETSGRDLRAWSKEWLEAAGVNTLRPSFTADGDGARPAFDSFSLVQEAPRDWPTLRSHRVAVGLYDHTEGSIVRRRAVELDAVGARTEVGELAGERVSDLVLVNDGDLTFAKMRLDPGSLATAVRSLGDLGDPLARTLCWSACWDMTRDGEMPARDFVRLVLAHVGRETKVGVVTSLLGQAASAVYHFGDPSRRDSAGTALADACRQGMEHAEPGSDHQLVWARSFIAAAGTPEQLAAAGALLDGSHEVPGLVVDTELRWHLVRSLAAAGAIDERAIGAEAERDRTDRGARHAAAALAARPSAEAKAAAWSTIVEDTSQPLALVEEVMGGFQQVAQEELLTPFVPRYFEALPEVWDRRDLPDALAFGRAMYPRLVVEADTLDRTDAFLGGDGVPAPIRRLLLEGRDGVARAMRTRSVDARAYDSEE
jgi:aminopeptidase N